jgi:transcriptional regulator with XRE-family HTH domain
MQDAPPIPNGIEAERIAHGIETRQELAERADLDPLALAQIEAGRVLPTRDELDRLVAAFDDLPADRLYSMSWRQIIGAHRSDETPSDRSRMFRDWSDRGHMLVARNELTWFERQPTTEGPVDAYVNLSCGTQLTPHLLLDTVAVLRALDVRFVAAAGPTACCGKPFRAMGRQDVGERHARARLERSQSWGASVHVNWCTACQQTSTAAAARRDVDHGVEHPVREVQVLSFVEERVRQLGDAVPWKRTVHRRVLAEGHPELSPIHREAQLASARLLGLIPGVTVAGLYDGRSEESPCAHRGRDSGSSPAWMNEPETPERIQAHRDRLADRAAALGADTVSCQHQGCHQAWSRYASDRLQVRHAISILADALGCDHPDRYQAAVRLGDPLAFMEQVRPAWESWGMSNDRALELAQAMCDPNFADPATRCSCGGEGGACDEQLVSIDVLTGTDVPLDAAAIGP